MKTNFIDNVGDNTLKNRFLSLSSESDEIKILIGYFFLSGYNKVFENGIKNKAKILVGLGSEKEIVNAVNNELKSIDDTKINVDGIVNFIKDLESGKIEIRQTREENHSKTYIFNFKDGEISERKVILGSSNFSEKGLEIRNEMNYEINNKQDVEYANRFFDKLWEISIILKSSIIIEKIKELVKQSFITPRTPYQLFLKTLHYIFENDKGKFITPTGYDDIEYQNRAASRALDILKNYNGVILGDVVGLGKSIIATKILSALGKVRALVLCKPTLISQWEKYIMDFYITGDVKSIGKIETISYSEYDVVVIDEAHNFRNDDTKRYIELQKICNNKKIILLSATIFNNDIEDIENILYLFQPRNSEIFETKEPLEAYFKKIKKVYKKSKQQSLFPEPSKFESLRTNILEKIMIRRTKKEIREQYPNEKIQFPKMKTPINIGYNFSEKVNNIFDRTIEILTSESKGLHYARHNAISYYKFNIEEKGNQNNAKFLIKTIFLKRLESSIYAFKETMKRVHKNYETYYLLVTGSKKVPVDKEVVKDVYSITDLNKFLEENQNKFNTLEYYSTDFVKDLEQDIGYLEELNLMWKNITEEDDNKFKEFIKQIKEKKFTDNFIVFSESADSVKFIYDSILKTKLYNENQILCITGNDLDKKTRELIDDNFNPKSKNPQSTIKILVTTDVLAEGVNLHKCNRLINYDITWNPVRLMQRNGRINRVGSEHKNTYIYNILPPTSCIDNNVKIAKGKLNVFLSLIGNDEYTLTEKEILNSVSYIEKEEEKYTSDVDKKYNYYYQIYKKIEQDKELYEQIINLPKNIKSCKKYRENGLITFYKKENTEIYGFIYNETDIGLYDGLEKIECDINEKQLKIKEDEFYDLLKKHRQQAKLKINLDMDLKKYEVELIRYLKENNLTEYADKVRNKELVYNAKTVLQDLKNGKDLFDVFKNTSKEYKREIILNELLCKDE